MKQNQKGFTLIELLAVIVILAVIALISTPIVMNVINRSRMKAAEDSAYGVVEAVKSKYAELLIDKSDALSEGIKVTFAAAGTGTVDGITEAAYKTVTITGTKPTSGYVNIDSKGNVTVSDLKLNNYYCRTKGGSGKDKEVIECKNNSAYGTVTPTT